MRQSRDREGAGGDETKCGSINHETPTRFHTGRTAGGDGADYFHHGHSVAGVRGGDDDVPQSEGLRRHGRETAPPPNCCSAIWPPIISRARNGSAIRTSGSMDRRNRDSSRSGKAGSAPTTSEGVDTDGINSFIISVITPWPSRSNCVATRWATSSRRAVPAVSCWAQSKRRISPFGRMRLVIHGSIRRLITTIRGPRSPGSCNHRAIRPIPIPSDRFGGSAVIHALPSPAFACAR